MDGSGYGNPDRGWNDPPKLAFCPGRTGNTAGPGRHRLLNKRVPIPVNPQATTPPSTMPPSLKASDSPPVKGGLPLHPPPVPPCPQPNITNRVPCAVMTPSDADVHESPTTQELLQQVHTSLLDSLKAVSDKLKESTQEEIRKRLDVMVDMWQKDQLSQEVQKRMLTLTQALSKHDYEEAWALHQSLIVDYTTTCSPWMVGIKSLVAESRDHSQAIPEQDKVTDDTKKTAEAEEDTVQKSDEGDSNVSSIK